MVRWIIYLLHRVEFHSLSLPINHKTAFVQSFRLPNTWFICESYTRTKRVKVRTISEYDFRRCLYSTSFVQYTHDTVCNWQLTFGFVPGRFPLIRIFLFEKISHYHKIGEQWQDWCVVQKAVKHLRIVSSMCFGKCRVNLFWIFIHYNLRIHMHIRDNFTSSDHRR